MVKAVDLAGVSSASTSSAQQGLHGGIGRAFKIGRSEVAAAVVSLQEWIEMDHETRLRESRRQLRTVEEELSEAPHVEPSWPGSEDDGMVTLRVTPDAAAIGYGISSCLDPNTSPSSTRATIASLTNAVIHPIKLTKPSGVVVNWRSMGSGGGFHYVRTPFELLQARASPLVTLGTSDDPRYARYPGAGWSPSDTLQHLSEQFPRHCHLSKLKDQPPGVAN